MTPQMDNTTNEVVQRTWVRIPGYDYRLEAVLKDTKLCATALVSLNTPDGDSGLAVHVYVEGVHHEAPLSTCKYTAHNMDEIVSLNIHAHSSNVFVVFVHLKNGEWPFLCFTRGESGAFQCRTFYTAHPVTNFAVISDHYIVVSEDVVRHRNLWVWCHDMRDTSKQTWCIATLNLQNYYMMYTYFETHSDAGTVTVHMLCGKDHALSLTVTENGVVKADGHVEWRWKRPCDTGFRKHLISQCK